VRYYVWPTVLIVYNTFLWLGWLGFSWVLLRQMKHASAESRRVASDSGQSEPKVWPKVAAVVAAYNEDPADFKQALSSLLANQHDYPGEMEIIVVDDGSSKNKPEIEAVLRWFAQQPDCWAFGYHSNRGKRMAQDVARQIMTALTKAGGNAHIRKFREPIRPVRPLPEWVFYTDSDTIHRYDVVRRLVATAVRKPSIGAVTGKILVANAKDSWLTSQQHLRYWLRCELERSAEGSTQDERHGSVLTAGGAIALYRTEALQKVWDNYVNQTFGKKRRPCTFGDDLKLTLEVEKAGYDVEYEPRAECHTTVPRTLRAYYRQQVRWNKSLYRETWIMFRESGIDLRASARDNLIAQLARPAWIVSNLLGGIIEWRSFGQPFLAVSGWTLMVSIAGLYMGYGFRRTRSRQWLLLPIYGLIHVGLLIPARIHALCTLTHNQWGTRAGGRIAVAEPALAVELQVYPAQVTVVDTVPGLPTCMVQYPALRVYSHRSLPWAGHINPVTPPVYLKVAQPGPAPAVDPEEGRPPAAVVEYLPTMQRSCGCVKECRLQRNWNELKGE
jgi:N-acetylglucosaminyltransferase